jgi:hypothetical protein
MLCRPLSPSSPCPRRNPADMLPSLRQLPTPGPAADGQWSTFRLPLVQQARTVQARQGSKTLGQPGELLGEGGGVVGSQLRDFLTSPSHTPEYRNREES